MEDKVTILFGVPVPSDNKVFLTFIVAHIILGLICVLAGLLAILINKITKIHKYAGKVYFFGYSFLFITIIITSIMRWPHNIHLLSIGSFGYSLAFIGRHMAQNHPKNWTRFHTALMGLSYVFLLAGFYVDNGRHLPFWNKFSRWQLFIFPFVIGVPIIIYKLFRHPLNKTHLS
ncbi:MAG: hypothetical protein K2X86_07480 [Cytophagaceae bacterium]|nr:hypothetical protein [Cytophagaceae bacterium]